MDTGATDRNGESMPRCIIPAGMRAILLVLAACTTPEPVAPTAPSLLQQIDRSRDLDHVVVGAHDGPTVAIVMASWCPHCRDEIRVFDRVRARHPRVRWLAINYKEHEEYDGRGNSLAIRAFANEVPWLRVVPADEQLFGALGRPPKIPTVLIFRDGQLTRYDRRDRGPPTASELDGLLP